MADEPSLCKQVQTLIYGSFESMTYSGRHTVQLDDHNKVDVYIRRFEKFGTPNFALYFHATEATTHPVRLFVGDGSNMFPVHVVPVHETCIVYPENVIPAYRVYGGNIHVLVRVKHFWKITSDPVPITAQAAGRDAGPHSEQRRLWSGQCIGSSDSGPGLDGSADPTARPFAESGHLGVGYRTVVPVAVHLERKRRAVCRTREVRENDRISRSSDRRQTLFSWEETSGTAAVIQCHHPEKQVIVMNGTDIYDQKQLRIKWDSGNAPVVVVPDDLILQFVQMTGIRNSQAIVHYSVPKTRDEFAFRFNLMSARFGDKENDVPLLSHLIVTKENAAQAHEITELYERLGIEVPDVLTSLRNSYTRGLCRRMASTGFCPFEKYFCYKDHFLIKRQNSRLPVAGQVKFFIGNIVTANEFYVRIMETRDDSSHGEWIQYPHQLHDIEVQLKRLRQEKHQPVADVHVGQMFAIIHGDEVRRVRVLDERRAELEHYESERRKYVHVFHVDYGSKTQVEQNQLIPVTDCLKKFPALAHRVFVTGLKPPENLITWSSESCDFVKSMFEKEEFHHLSGWVFITASNCMWMEDVKVHHRLKSIAGGINTMGETFVETLIEKGFAVPAPLPPFPGHNKNQLQLKTGFRIREQWKIARNAFLPENQLLDVNLICFKSVTDFYVRRDKFDSYRRA